MDFNSTIDIIIKDLEEARSIIDDLKKYPGVPGIQVELARAKCKSAAEILAYLKDIQNKNAEGAIAAERSPAVNEDQKPPVQVIEISYDMPTVDQQQQISESGILADRFSLEDEEYLKSGPVASLDDAIGINDRFYFIREMFSNSRDLYVEVISRLEKIHSIEDAKEIILTYTKDESSKDAGKQLLDLVKESLSQMNKLVIVPTPIGNLGDITFRAVEVLEKADLILAEDTRQASKLLSHYNIKTPLQSHHMFNEHKSAGAICEKILAGKTIALISDAGTPGISDPGFLLVRSCLEKGIIVETLPGATALIPALVNSGLPCERFCFEGFLPPKKGRRKRLSGLQEETRTLIFYESPYRLVRTLDDLAEHFGPDREACVSRELTKIYEENIKGTLSFLSEHYKSNLPKGEIVIVVSGKRD